MLKARAALGMRSPGLLFSASGLCQSSRRAGGPPGRLFPWMEFAPAIASARFDVQNRGCAHFIPSNPRVVFAGPESGAARAIPAWGHLRLLSRSDCLRVPYLEPQAIEAVEAAFSAGR